MSEPVVTTHYDRAIEEHGYANMACRRTTAQLFFTACHYERVGVTGAAIKALG